MRKLQNNTMNNDFGYFVVIWFKNSPILHKYTSYFSTITDNLRIILIQLTGNRVNNVIISNRKKKFIIFKFENHIVRLMLTVKTFI